MPYRIDPTSHDGRVTLLTVALATTTTDRAAGRPYVPQEWLTQATAFLAAYQPKVTAIAHKLGAQRNQIYERDLVVPVLAKYVRHGWQVLKMRNDRLGLPEGLLDVYGLPPGGHVPFAATPHEWVNYAKKFVEGDAASVTQGRPAMVNPSATEIQDILTEVQAVIGEVSDAVAEYDEALEAAEKEVAQANELIGDLIAYLEFALRKEPPSSQRQEMRRYGIKYGYRTGELPDPEEPGGEKPA